MSKSASKEPVEHMTAGKMLQTLMDDAASVDPKDPKFYQSIGMMLSLLERGYGVLDSVPEDKKVEVNKAMFAGISLIGAIIMNRQLNRMQSLAQIAGATQLVVNYIEEQRKNDKDTEA